MTVVLLSAGRGTRFDRESPKCLMEVDGMTLLERTVSQIRNQSSKIPIFIVTGHMSEEVREIAESISDDFIQVVHNSNFANDQNILSAQTALLEIDGEALIIEGDCIFNQQSFEAFISHIGLGENIFFTKNAASFESSNSIILSKDGMISGYHKGERELGMDMDGWRDMAGGIIVNKEGIDLILNATINGGYDPKSTYYFQPLADRFLELQVSASELPTEAEFRTFNTHFQYLQSLSAMGIPTTIELVEVCDLSHVEGFSQKRVGWLMEKITSEEIWNLPICIDREYGIVMDGQHRMEVAKSLGLSLIPAIKFSHSEVDFWSLRDNHEVSLEKIINNHNSGDIYPYKTVKYGFPFPIPDCSISLEELR